MNLAVPISLTIALAVAAIAAVWDWRKGEIPNWLTLPPLVGAPLVYGLTLGAQYAITSALAILACGVIPYFLFRARAMGGGDVKLFAALGAITGFNLRIGVELQLGAMIVAAVFAMGRLAWNGGLLRTLGNSFFIALNPVLPQAKRREISSELMTVVRMGVPILVATCWIAAPFVVGFWLNP